MLVPNLTFYHVRKGFKIIYSLLILLKTVNFTLRFLSDNLDYCMSPKILNSWVFLLVLGLIW